MASLTLLGQNPLGGVENAYLLTTSKRPLDSGFISSPPKRLSLDGSDPSYLVPSKIAPKRSIGGTDSAAKQRPNKTRSSSRREGAAPAVARRNERERNRVRQVNLGFATLRQHVPSRSKKMSKVETLRSAVQYIRQLQQLLQDEEGLLDSSRDQSSSPSFDPQQFPHLSIKQEDESQDSPAPSLGSDASSPYDSLSPEDEDLLDFTTWLS